jgi:hypothetical protein
MLRHADLAGEEDVLAGLRHRAVSSADTTRIAPSIWAAPVIMFLTKSAWPGQSTWA